VGRIDQFLMQHVSSGLEPGESIQAMGLLRDPVVINIMGVPQRYEDYLGVATDRRLIVFETETSNLLGVSVKPVARNPVEWRYDELAEVRIAPVAGLIVHSGGIAHAVALVPHPNCGPKAAKHPVDHPSIAERYDIYVKIDDIDGQGAFCQQFPQWLQRQVAAGAFPMHPEKRAAIEQRVGAARAKIFADRAQRIAEAAARDAKMKAWWEKNKLSAIPIGLAVVGLGLLLTGAGMGVIYGEEMLATIDDVEHYESQVDMLEKDLKTWVRDPKLDPPADCPEKDWPPPRWGTAPKNECHNCTVYATPRPDQPMAPGYRRVRRGTGEWACPSPEWYERNLATARKNAEEGEEQRAEKIMYFIMGMVFLLLGLASIPAALIARKKLRARAAAAAPAPAPVG
jgi:hypothetical protein